MRKNIKAFVNIFIPLSFIIFFLKLIIVSVAAERMKAVVPALEKQGGVALFLDILPQVYWVSVIAACVSAVMLIIWLLIILISKGTTKYLLKTEKALIVIASVWLIDVVIAPLFYTQLQAKFFDLVYLIK